MNFRNTIIFVLILCLTIVGANEALKEVSERFPVVVLPVTETTLSPEFSRINEIAANVLVAEAVKLGRFEVYDRNRVQEILQEHALQLTLDSEEESSSSISSVDSLEELDTWAMLQASTSSRKAFKVSVTHLNQEGKPDEDKGFLGALFVTQAELESNIETEVEIQFARNSTRFLHDLEKRD